MDGRYLATMSKEEEKEEEEEIMEDDPTSGIVTTMVIFCSVAFVIFSIIYIICWYRAAKEKKKQQRAINNAAITETSPTEHTTSADIPTTDEDEEEEDGAVVQTRPQPPPPIRRQYTQEWSPSTERQLGQPIYDKYLVGGTISLMILLWIGAIIVLIMSLMEQSNFKNASIDDFQSLGQNSCRIILENNNSTTTYNYYDDKLNALNTVCIEIWEYTVEVVLIGGTNNNNEQSTYFVSAPVTLGSCYSSCENCLLNGKLHGSNYYAGLDPLKKGRYITNTTFVECWEPTIPTIDLSDYYDCGNYQLPINSTCYLLEDTSIKLKENQNSSQTGLIAAYICFIGGIILLLLVVYFKYKNKKVYEEEMQQLQQQQEREREREREGETDVEVIEEEDVSSVMSSSNNNNNKDHLEEEGKKECINDDDDDDKSQ